LGSSRERGKIRILVSRHSAFYSPLIGAIAGGFLADEGLEATYGVLPKGKSARDLIRAGEVDVVQAAVSSSWGPMERGETDLPVHFAQINQRDGFLLAGRLPDTSFEWKSLEGRTLVADHGGQPLVMLRYAAARQGVDWGRIDVLDAGDIAEIDASFRAGCGDYVHQQGPQPQQLEKDGIAHVVAAVGAAMPPVAFSSLMASRQFLSSGAARAFMRAYRRSRAWVRESAADAVAEKESEFFHGTPREVLASAIARYQALGCWEGECAIARDLYEQALEVFLHSGAIGRRHPYDEVVVPPPGE
jgi:NitT/TauT family transport system substrate-binding protein